jgi:ABC-2 type transport system ATP-binding protein
VQLEVRNLTKTYASGVQALKDISLTIPTGMFGLLGPNGSGKTTLMRSIATLQDVDQGSIRFNGTDVLKEKEAVRRVLGYLPQEFGVYPGVSAENLLSHLAVLKGIMNPKERAGTVDSILKRVNLWGERKRKLGTYSGGMRQRFGVAQALLGNPQLIMVDEPTAGLDPEERIRFLNLLSEIGENVVVILSTHIVEDVSELCTKMAIIHEGTVYFTGTPKEALDRVRGRTWRKTIDRSELPGYERRHVVLSKRLTGGRTIIHVLSDGRPDDSFEMVQEDLRDAYFAILSHSAQVN